jgi:glyoxylase-like metal-dependent hydrolase (beta-lactamase superfamily II)
VKDLVAAVGKITPQPIKYVVVGSEHGDHIGGDTAFPESNRMGDGKRAPVCARRHAEAPPKLPVEILLAPSAGRR